MAIEPQDGGRTKVPGLIYNLIVVLWACVTAAATMGTAILADETQFALGVISIGLGVLLGYSNPPPGTLGGGGTAKPGDDPTIPNSAIKRGVAGAILAGLLAVGMMANSGCLGLSRPDPAFAIGSADTVQSQECADLDSAYIGFSAAASATSGLSGAAGLALATWPDPTREERIAVGTVGAGLGVLSVTFGLVRDLYAQRYVERCGGP